MPRSSAYRLAFFVALNLTTGVLHGQRRSVDDRIGTALAAAEEGLVAFRRDLHLHPELSGEETRTAERVADALRTLGLEVRTGIGGHGVVAVLRGGRPGPVVAYRADMDAVSDPSPDPVPFRSLAAGIRHICGHDVHTTIGVAIATALAPLRAEIAGTVLFIFQPAEERATGAREMLADSVYGGLHPEAIYAVHTAPYEVGILGTRAGGLMAARDLANIELTGSGDMAAASAAVERILRAASTLPPGSRFVEADPDSFTLIEWNQRRVRAGQHGFRVNVVLANTGVRERLRAHLAHELSVLGVPGVRATLSYEVGATAGVTNDSLLVERGNTAIRDVLGTSVVRQVRTVLPAFSEDFGEFQRTVPGVMYFLGVSNTPAGTAGMPHSPDYVADEGSILVGARAMSAVLLDRLSSR